MHRYIVNKYVAATLATVLAAAPALAQTPESVVTGGQSTFSLTPYAGYMMFGSLAEISPDVNLTNDDSWLAGAQAKIRMTSRWSVIGNVAYTKSNLEVEEEGGTGPDTRASADLGYWMADAGLQYQLPFSWNEGKISPFVQGGIGAVRYTAEADDFDSESSTNLQFNGGVGLDIDRGPIGFQLMLKDYVTSLDWNKFGDFADQVDADTIDRSRIAHNLALTAGIRINF
jgi:opacity protein-like surface antigen